MARASDVASGLLLFGVVPRVCADLPDGGVALELDALDANELAAATARGWDDPWADLVAQEIAEEAERLAENRRLAGIMAASWR